MRTTIHTLLQSELCEILQIFLMREEKAFVGLSK